LLLLPAACLAGLLGGIASGGRLERVLARPPRGLVVLVSAGGLGAVAAAEGVVAPWVASSGLVGLFAALNLRRWGMPLVLLATLSNMLVVSANGAMPVTADAAEAIGYSASDIDGGLHTHDTQHTVAAALGDRIPLPAISQVVSVGDVLLVVGGCMFMFAASRGAHEGRLKSNSATSLM